MGSETGLTVGVVHDLLGAAGLSCLGLQALGRQEARQWAYVYLGEDGSVESVVCNSTNPTHQIQCVMCGAFERVGGAWRYVTLAERKARIAKGER